MLMYNILCYILKVMSYYKTLMEYKRSPLEVMEAVIHFSPQFFKVSNSMLNLYFV